MSMEVSGPLEGEFRRTIVVRRDRPDPDEPIPGLELELEDLDRPLQLWVQDVRPGIDRQVRELGLEPYRDLWQLGVALPAEGDVLATRPFSPDHDADELIAVNNRAFSWHPEQGGMTRADLDARMNERWFDPEGLRIHDFDGTIAGFCWTKEHRDETPAVGEIYVIAVDPAFHGQGLGQPLTLAGLAHLASRGLEHGILYVESDNHPANKVYTRIGFRHRATDRAYRLRE